MINALKDALLEAGIAGERICINYLESTPYSVSISGGGAVPVRRYADGGAYLRHSFTLSVRVPSTRQISEGLRAHRFCECLVRWLKSEEGLSTLRRHAASASELDAQLSADNRLHRDSSAVREIEVYVYTAERA